MMLLGKICFMMGKKKNQETGVKSQVSCPDSSLLFLIHINYFETSSLLARSAALSASLTNSER